MMNVSMPYHGMLGGFIWDQRLWQWWLGDCHRSFCIVTVCSESCVRHCWLLIFHHSCSSGDIFVAICIVWRCFTQMRLVVDEYGIPADRFGVLSIQFVMYGLFLVNSSMNNIVVIYCWSRRSLCLADGFCGIVICRCGRWCKFEFVRMIWW